MDQRKTIRNYYLIGPSIEKFDTTTLPSNREVLQLYFNKYYNLNEARIDLAKSVATDVIALYNKYDISMKEKKNVIRQVNSLFAKYENVRKSKNRKIHVSFQTIKFQQEIDTFFDITSKDALKKIKNPKVRNMLYNLKKNKKNLRPKRAVYTENGKSKLINSCL